MTKQHEIIIEPLSPFGSPLAGDQLFGAACLQAAEDPNLFGARISDLLESYDDDPFIVVSSAVPRFDHAGGAAYAFRKPSFPPGIAVESDKRKAITERKESKRKEWFVLGGGKRLDKIPLPAGALLTGEELSVCMGGSGGAISMEVTHARNSINRLTSTTGGKEFAPYSSAETFYYPGQKFSVFIHLSEKTALKSAIEAFERVGRFGYGRDASVGLGKFRVVGNGGISLSDLGSVNPNAVYTLSPCVPEKNGKYRKAYFSVFTRFGKHGGQMARAANPFKKPVVMADAGAVLMPVSKEAFVRPIVGAAAKGVSKEVPGAVTQGYSLYIPTRVEVEDEEH